MFEHLKGSHNKTLNGWLAKTTPTIGVVCGGLSSKAAQAIEMFWIAVIGRKDKARGPLFNHTDGGEGCSGYKMTAEQTAKRVAEALGKPLTESHKQSLRDAKRPPMPTNVEAMRQANLGKKQTPVTCPHCGKVGGHNTMLRWHFDKCAERKEYA
jgi:hypothetical protein